MKKHIFLLFLAALALAAAIGMQFYERIAYPPVITRDAPLADVISKDIPGWESEEVELAKNEELEESILKILNFSDVVSRVYRRGPYEVSIWVAYWEPLKMPVRQVGSHTPDVCWVKNGWECQKAANKVNLTVEGTPLKSSEYREYTFKGSNKQHVYFWHLVGGKVFTASNQMGQWDRWNLLTDFARFGFNQKREQYFIRLQSPRPFDAFWDDDGFQLLLEQVVEAAGLTADDIPAPLEASAVSATHL